jgi:very-short-patch-repair endonuclease
MDKRRPGTCQTCGGRTCRRTIALCRPCSKAARERPGCLGCGAKVSHTGSVRCKACWLKHHESEDSVRQKQYRECEREGCAKPLTKTQWQFCSPQCRNFTLNKARSGPKEETDLWTKERLDYLYANYPTQGAKGVARALGMTRNQVISKANILKIALTETAMQRLVHDGTAKRMREDNPSRRPGAGERISKWIKNNPSHLAKLAAGQAKLQKENPTKLEAKMSQILRLLGVTHEHHVEIKPNFIVDFRVGMLIIEADGDYWHGHPSREPLTQRQIKQQKRDAARNKYLTKCGYVVVRIWESDTNVDFVRKVIEQHEELIAAYMDHPERPLRVLEVATARDVTQPVARTAERPNGNLTQSCLF